MSVPVWATVCVVYVQRRPLGKIPLCQISVRENGLIDSCARRSFVRVGQELGIGDATIPFPFKSQDRL